MEDAKNGMEILPVHVGSGLCSGHDIPTDKTDVCTDSWSALESGIFGDLGDGDLMGYSADQEDLDSTCESPESLILATLRNLPNTRKGRLGIGSAMVAEFDDVGEQIAYLLIQERVRNCFIDSASKRDHKEGIDWVFTYLPDEHRRTFKECCEVLRVRPWLLQTRVHFQFYRKGLVFDDQFPFETVPMPGIIQGEAAYYGGDEGSVMANMAWLKPGIAHKELATSQAAVRSLNQLEEKGIMAEHGGGWYTTGRNPLMVEHLRRSVSWSYLWPRETGTY